MVNFTGFIPQLISLFRFEGFLGRSVFKHHHHHRRPCSICDANTSLQHFFLYTDDYIRLVEGYSDETFTDKTLFLCMFELSERVKQSRGEQQEVTESHVDYD